MALPKLFKKKEKPVPISPERKSLIKLPEGTLIDIQPMKAEKSDNPSDGGFTYTSILHDFPTNETADIFVNAACKTTLEIGVPYNITFKTGAGIFKDTVEVLEFFTRDDAPHISIKLTGKTSKQQRRRHPRIEDYLKFDFEIIEKKAPPQPQVHFESVVEQFENFQKQKEVEELKMRKYMNVFFERSLDTENPIVFPYSAETLDISAGGMRFVSNYKLEAESIIGVALDLNKTRPVLIIGKINHVEDLTKYNNATSNNDHKLAIHSLSMFKNNSKLDGLIEPELEVNDTYSQAANLNYIYKCVFVAMNDDSKSYLHDYIMDKTLL